MLKLRPAGICRRSVIQFELMSPDQDAAAFLCCPAKADRVKIATRFLSVFAR